MRAWLLIALAFWLGLAEASASPSALAIPAAESLTSIPMGKGLPVIVRAGLFFQAINGFDENKGSFTGVVDMRLRWQDPRLQYASEETPRGFKEYTAEQADSMLTQLWVPGALLDNLDGEAVSTQTRNLRIYPDGWVELMQRTRGTFLTEISADKFPFDKQGLAVQVVVNQRTTKEATLVVLQQDLDFSNVAKGVTLDGWDIGFVTLARTLHNGWYGTHHAGVKAVLEVHRQVGAVIGPIFIPLLACLFIPLLAIWMNTTEDGEFTEGAFEFANIIVGGLFAVIALNFAINSSYQIIATGDNLVTRLFALNYIALAVSMVIVVVLFRLNLFMKLFGRRTQKAIFDYLYWALPALVSAIALGLITMTWA